MQNKHKVAGALWFLSKSKLTLVKNYETFLKLDKLKGDSKDNNIFYSIVIDTVIDNVQ